MDTVRHILQVKGFDLWTIRPEQSVYDALRMMADKDVGSLVVMEGEQLVGIFSERDYARKIILKGKTSVDTRVEEVMSGAVVTIHPDQTVQECMELMNHHKVRHLPVVENDQVIGVVSLGDAVRHVIFHQREIIRASEPHNPMAY